MADIEKVIKAVECRVNSNGNQGCVVGWDIDCPYAFSHVFCDAIQLKLDVLKLLKELKAEKERKPVIVCPHCGKRVK